MLESSLEKLEASRMRVMRPIAPLIDKEELSCAVTQVIDNAAEGRQSVLLVEDEKYYVLLVPGSRMGVLLDQIGSLREETFREVGEGSGLSRDIDEYDAAYEHLILWDRGEQAIAGAYRLGRVEKLIYDSSGRRNLDRLYSHKLFGFDERLLKRFGSALELGRSFVISQYQKSDALTYIWKGIAEYLLRHGDICTLFGPVSISGNYSDRSKSIMVEYLQSFYGHPQSVEGLLKLSAPYSPSQILSPEQLSEFRRQHSTLAKLSKFIGIEEGSDEKGVPQLVRFYADILMGQYLAFNHDPDFNTIDGLVVVDLAKLAQERPQILARFLDTNRLGRDRLERFIQARLEPTPLSALK